MELDLLTDDSTSRNSQSLIGRSIVNGRWKKPDGTTLEPKNEENPIGFRSIKFVTATG
jgi:hypothetical protein